MPDATKPSSVSLDLEKALDKHIRPDSFPLAIRMAKEDEPIPERAKRPKADLGVQIAICQTFSLARRYGWQMVIGQEDISCPLALTAFGFKPESPSFSCGDMCAGMYTSGREAGAKTESEVAKFSFQEYTHIIAAPLSRTNFDPQLYLVYGNSAQIMRLLTAWLWQEGGYVTSRFSGRLDCADICIETIQTGKAQVILPCYGDRVFGQTQDHEMALTIPAGKEQRLIEGLEGTHKGGIRYPVPSFLQYEPKFPKHYYKLFSEWDEMEKN